MNVFHNFQSAQDRAIEGQRSVTRFSGTRTRTAGLIALMAVLLVVGVPVFFTAGCGQAPPSRHASSYHCPMHPTVISDKPGDCPICGMKLVMMAAATPAGAAADATPADQTARFHCPMHPTIVSDKPGDCPICGMKLVPMAAVQRDPAEPAGPDTATVPGLAAVTIAPAARERMGLTFGTVEKRPLSRDVRTSARILADETRLYHVTVKVEGWIEKLFVATTGQAVKKGEPLLTIYSPEVVSAQDEYLTALHARSQLAQSNPDAAASGEALVAGARRRLEYWDISDAQIERLAQTGQTEKSLTLYAPANGWVLERMVVPGHKIMPNEPLMVVGDLTRVWGDADIYASDLPYIKTGMAVAITLPYWPGNVFTGTVSFITPTLDPETRTMRARLEIGNPDATLKPEMYADAHLHYDLGERLVVPEQAVMRTGLHSYAFREGDDGKLIPTEITLGTRGDGYYEVVSGLKAGDKVVTSANFLVDSESSSQAAIEALTQ